MLIAQSAGAVEYTDFISADGNPHNECPGYDTKQSDSEAFVNTENFFVAVAPRFSHLEL